MVGLRSVAMGNAFAITSGNDDGSMFTWREEVTEIDVGIVCVVEE